MRGINVRAMGVSCRATSAEGERPGGEDGREEDGGERGGGVAVITKQPEVETKKEVTRKSSFEGNWRVLLHRCSPTCTACEVMSHTDLLSASQGRLGDVGLRPGQADGVAVRAR